MVVRIKPHADKASTTERPGGYRLVVERVEGAPDGTSRIYRSLERQVKFVR